jgi:hypothetical protein
MVNQFGQHVPDYPGQQPYQDQAYMRYWTQQQHQQNQQMFQQNQQPARTVEVVQEKDEKSAIDFPVPCGNTKIIIGQDESFVLFKRVSVSGQVTLDFFDKRPPAPPTPELNPADYVRKDEIASLIEKALKAERNETEGV